MVLALIKFAVIMMVLNLAAAVAEEPPQLPTAPPPTIVMASLLKLKGPVQIELVIPNFVDEARRRVVQHDGKNVEEEYHVAKGVFETKVFTLDEDVQIVDRAGKPVKADALPALMKRKLPVLFSVEPKVDPFYLQVFRDDVLIVVVHVDKN